MFYHYEHSMSILPISHIAILVYMATQHKVYCMYRTKTFIHCIIFSHTRFVFSSKTEWQQVSSVLQNSPEYSYNLTMLYAKWSQFFLWFSILSVFFPNPWGSFLAPQLQLVSPACSHPFGWRHLCRKVRLPNPQPVSRIWNKILWWWGSCLGCLGNVEYPLYCYCSQVHSARSGSTWQNRIYRSNRTVWYLCATNDLC